MTMITDFVKKVMARQMAETVQAEAAGAIRPVGAELDVPQLVRRRARREQSRWLAEELDVPMPTRFASVFDFVDEVVLDLYGFDIANDRKWCRRWWDHPAAVRRLTMMWASWEHHRAERPATGEEEWARVVGDHHMAWLAGPFGPFTACQFEHVATPPLASEPIPLDRIDDDSFGGGPVVPAASSDGAGPSVREGQSGQDEVAGLAADPATPAGETGFVLGQAVPGHRVDDRQASGDSRIDAGAERSGRRGWRLPGFGS